MFFQRQDKEPETLWFKSPLIFIELHLFSFTLKRECIILKYKLNKEAWIVAT